MLRFWGAYINFVGAYTWRGLFSEFYGILLWAMHFGKRTFKTPLQLLKSNILNCCLIISQQFDLLKIGLKMRE